MGEEKIQIVVDIIYSMLSENNIDPPDAINAMIYVIANAYAASGKIYEDLEKDLMMSIENYKEQWPVG